MGGDEINHLHISTGINPYGFPYYLREGSDKNVNVLMITYHFTQYSQAFITPKQTAPCVAKTPWENFLIQYGWPEKNITNQGKTFESQLVKELCNLAEVQKLRTTSYRPQRNSNCE